MTPHRHRAPRAAALAAVATILLVGCVPHPIAPEDGPVLRINPNEPVVEVLAGDVIVVDQDPIYIRGNAPDKSITWTLTSATRRDWILVSVNIGANRAGQNPFRCRPQNEFKFRCDNDGLRGDFKYTITVKHKSDGRTFTSPDPWIRNG